jgi:hypothetical protein
MNVTPTQRHASLFVERNQFLQALLGLSANGRRVRSWIRSLARAEGAPVRLAGDSRFMLFLLGVVSAQKTLERHVQAFAVETSAEPSPAATRDLPCLRDLLK